MIERAKYLVTSGQLQAYEILELAKRHALAFDDKECEAECLLLLAKLELLHGHLDPAANVLDNVLGRSGNLFFWKETMLVCIDCHLQLNNPRKAKIILESMLTVLTRAA